MAEMQINGADVLATYNFTLGAAPGWSDAPPRQTPTGNIAVRGVRPTGASIDLPRRVTLSGLVRGSSAAVARTNLDKLKLALSATPVKLSFSDHPDRYIHARLDSFGVQADPMGSAISKHLACSIVLTAHDPFFYDQTETELLLGGVMPMGTGIVRPVINLVSVISAPPFFVDLENHLGAVVQTMEINEGGGGVTFVIDCDRQIITADGTNILDKLTGDFFRIDPLIHANFATSAWPEIVTRNIDSGASPHVVYRKAWR